MLRSPLRVGYTAGLRTRAVRAMNGGATLDPRAATLHEVQAAFVGTWSKVRSPAKLRKIKQLLNRSVCELGYSVPRHNRVLG